MSEPDRTTVYTTYSSRGQIVIPSEIRDALKLTTGTKIAVHREGNTVVLRPITDEFIDSLMGCTRGAGAIREAMHREDER